MWILDTFTETIKRNAITNKLHRVQHNKLHHVQHNKLHQVQHNKTHFTSSANCYTFRHQCAIIRELKNNQRSWVHLVLFVNNIKFTDFQQPKIFTTPRTRRKNSPGLPQLLVGLGQTCRLEWLTPKHKHADWSDSLLNTNKWRSVETAATTNSTSWNGDHLILLNTRRMASWCRNM